MKKKKKPRLIQIQILFTTEFTETYKIEIIGLWLKIAQLAKFDHP